MDKFAIYYYHGGRFANVGDTVVYFNGQIMPKHGLDADRIGYLDLVDDMEKLGYSGIKMSYRVPGLDFADGLRVIKDDKQVMDMLKLVSEGDGMINVYVEGVKSGCRENMVPQSPCEANSKDIKIRATSSSTVSDIKGKEKGEYESVQKKRVKSKGKAKKSSHTVSAAQAKPSKESASNAHTLEVSAAQVKTSEVSAAPVH